MRSPGNTERELADKLAFYDRYGVEEYYLYDRDTGSLQGWQRSAGRLESIPQMRGWISPRLGIRFDIEGLDLCLYRPDGERFVSYPEAMRRAQEEAAARRSAEAELARLKALLKEKGIDF